MEHLLDRPRRRFEYAKCDHLVQPQLCGHLGLSSLDILLLREDVLGVCGVHLADAFPERVAVVVGEGAA